MVVALLCVLCILCTMNKTATLEKAVSTAASRGRNAIATEGALTYASFKGVTADFKTIEKLKLLEAIRSEVVDELIEETAVEVASKIEKPKSKQGSIKLGKAIRSGMRVLLTRYDQSLHLITGDREAHKELKEKLERMSRSKPTISEMKAAALERGRNQPDLLEAEGGCASAAEFAKLAGIAGRNTVYNWKKEGNVIALPKGNNRFVYPKFQAYDGALLNGLSGVLNILRQRGYTDRVIADFMLLEQESESGKLKRPIDLMRKGRSEEAARMAERYGETGA